MYSLCRIEYSFMAQLKFATHMVFGRGIGTKVLDYLSVSYILFKDRKF